MERLTQRRDDGSVVIATKCPEMCEYATCSMEEGYQCQHQCEGDIMQRLADYEDAEEQGLLLRLPCKVGDTVYKIPNFTAYRLHIIKNRPQDNKVYETKITSIKKDDECRYVLNYSNYYPGYRLEDYGKEWFLTREEAEQALIEVGKRYEAWKAGGKV